MVTYPRERNSSIELCRITAMSLIVIHHFILHVLRGIYPSSDLLTLIGAFFICGVNLFFLISGYFGIRLSIMSIAKLITLIIFFEILNYIFLYISGHEINLEAIMNLILFPISKSEYWFLQVYLLLMACAPIINCGLSNLPLKELRFCIILLTLLTIWSCAIGHNLSNPNGYTFLQGVYIYCMGYFLHRDIKFRSLLSSNKGLTLFLCSSICSGCGIVLLKSPFWTAYNGLPIIAASIGLFSVFVHLDFHSRIINVIAHSSLGVYLLQDGIFGHTFLYDWQKDMSIQLNNTLYTFVFFICSFFALWVIAIVLTSIYDKTIALIIKNLFSSNLLSERQ